MPAQSKAQQRAAGMALAAKKGRIPVSRLKGSSKDMFQSMSIEELEEFAFTKHKRLPRRKKRK